MVSKNGPWLHPGKHCIKATCVSAFAVKNKTVFPGRVNERRRRRGAAGGRSRGFISGPGGSKRCGVRIDSSFCSQLSDKEQNSGLGSLFTQISELSVFQNTSTRSTAGLRWWILWTINMEDQSNICLFRNRKIKLEVCLRFLVFETQPGSWRELGS